MTNIPNINYRKFLPTGCRPRQLTDKGWTEPIVLGTYSLSNNSPKCLVSPQYWQKGFSVRLCTSQTQIMSWFLLSTL